MKTKPYKKIFEYKTCGLPNVFLNGGVDIAETSYGPAYRVRDAEKLHELLALYVIQKESPLTGEEIRYLRGEADMLTQLALADMLGVESQTVARWEKKQTAIPTSSDKLLRIVFADLLFKCDEKAIHKIVHNIVRATKFTASQTEHVEVKRGSGRWNKPALAA